MLFITVKRFVALNATFSMLFAFFTTAAIAAEPLTYIGFDEASHSAAAHEGMQEIFSGRCFHGGVPIRAAMTMAATAPKAKADLGYNPETPEGRFYASGFLPSPKDRRSGMLPGMPLGGSVFTRNGVMLANGNCFNCHAGVVHGKVVAGLGNSHGDQAAGLQGSKGLAGQQEKVAASLKTDAEKKEFAEFIANADDVASALKYAKTRGDNFGPYPVWRLGARLADPEKTGMVVSAEKTELDKLMDATELPTVDPMAWWLLKYKTKDYWYADGAPDDAAHFSFNFTTAHPEVNETRAEHVKSVAKALAFARETQSPLYPETLNADLVQKGADLFHGRTKPTNASGFVSCKNCHGSYTKKDSEPDLSKPGSWTVDYNNSAALKDVKTDTAYNDTLVKFAPIVTNINKLQSYFEAKGTPELTPKESVPTKKGYVAPPLVGVWASAPYFHNGSVPTIEAVLNSEDRPEIWSRNNTDPHAYNLQEVGLEYKALTPDEFNTSAAAASSTDFRSKAAIDHRAVYDTRGFGRSNTGHQFADNLTSDERVAVIEFLKSLSGADM